MINNYRNSHPVGVGKGEVHPKLELPIYGLPKRMQEYINELTRMYQCPREFVTVAVLSAISTVAGNRVSISDGIYTNSLSLWWVNIARSGSNKTQPVKKVMKALAQIDEDIYRDYLEKMREWERREKSKDEEPMAKPRYRTLMVGDMTEESRHAILNDNPNGVIGYYPEIKGFFEDLERYNKNGSIARVLRLWDNDTIKVTRKTEDKPIVIDRPFMNILGDLQPDLIDETFGNKAFMTSGLPQRFLFCVPDKVDFPERSNYTLPHMVESYLPSCLRALYNNCYPGTAQPIISTDIIRLSTDAETLYECYYNKLQHMKEDTRRDYVASVYSKAQIQVLRLAGIIHVAKALEPSEGFDFATVSDETMRYAIDCMEYFLESAKRVEEKLLGKRVVFTESDKQALIGFTAHFPVNNISQFAHSIGKDRGYVSRLLNQRN